MPGRTRVKHPQTVRRKKTILDGRDTATKVDYAITWLQRRGTKANREGMARYGIVAKKVIGVSVGSMRTLAREFGRDHKLSRALWKTGIYEGRMLAALVGEPDRVTPAEMERYAKAFDNWAICDTMTFVLWDRSAHAWPKVREWSTRREEFVSGRHSRCSPASPCTTRRRLTSGTSRDWS